MANSVNDTSKPPFFASCCYTRSGVFLCLLPQQRRRSWSVYQFYRFLGYAYFLYGVLLLVFVGYRNATDITEDCEVSDALEAIKDRVSGQFHSSYWTRTREGLTQFTEWTGQALACDSDWNVHQACPAADYRFLQAAVTGLCVAVWFKVVSATMLQRAFRYFSRMPRELIMAGNARRRTWTAWIWDGLYGFLAKQGPLLHRLFSALEVLFFALLAVGWGTSMCRGDLRYTRECLEGDMGCAMYRIANCRYFYALVQSANGPAREEFPDCYDQSIYSPFSGLADVRFLTEQRCLKEAFLTVDVRRAANMNDFDVLSLADDRDGSSGRWACPVTSNSCPFSADWGAVVCACPDQLRGILDATLLGNLLTQCNLRRGLTQEENTMQTPLRQEGSTTKTTWDLTQKETTSKEFQEDRTTQPSMEEVLKKAHQPSMEEVLKQNPPSSMGQSQPSSMGQSQPSSIGQTRILQQGYNVEVEATACSWGSSDDMQNFAFDEENCDKTSWLYDWIQILGCVGAVLLLSFGLVSAIWIDAEVEPWLYNSLDCNQEPKSLFARIIRFLGP